MLGVVRSMPVDPSTAEQSCTPTGCVRSTQNGNSSPFQDFRHTFQRCYRVGDMLDDLIHRDIVEKILFVQIRIEQSDMNPETVSVCNASDIFICLDAIDVTATRFMVTKRLAEAAADVEHPDVLRHPAVGRVAFTFQPGRESFYLLCRPVLLKL